MERISSRQNATVKRFRELGRSRAADDWMLLDGQHLVEEALSAGIRLDVVAFGERVVPGRLATLAAQSARAGARTLSVSDEVLAAMSPVERSSGVVAIAQRPAASIDDVLARAPQLVLMLSGIQDPGNVGAIIRAAEACGATGVVTGEATADPLGWKALRGSMGSTLRLPVAARQPLEQVASSARHAGLRVIATVPRGGTPLPQADLRHPCAVLLGGEGGGLSDALLSDADERITIPMKPPVESLNVSIAAALILYEASRQRSAGPVPRK
jgi:TrmH family RNA methyltransferase